MDKPVKQRIQKLWRNRFLLGFSGVVVIGFAGWQLHTFFEASPQQPAWSLNLSRLSDDLVNSGLSEDKCIKILSEIRVIAQKQSLLATHDLVVAYQVPQEKTGAWEPNYQEVARVLEQGLEQDQVLDRVLELEEVRTRARALERMQVRVHGLAQAWARELELVQKLELARSRVIELELELELGQVLEPELVQTLEKVWEREQELEKVRTDTQTLGQGLVMEQTFQHVTPSQPQALIQAVARVRELQQEPTQTRVQVQELERAQMQAQALVMKQAQEMEQAQAWRAKQAQEWSGKQLLELAHAREQELAQELERMQGPRQTQERVQVMNDLLIHLVSEELREKHGIELQQGTRLEQVLNNEPHRARTFMQSGILLAVAVVLLSTILVALLRSKGPYPLSRTAQLVAFLPEECVAELGVVYRRMKKRKVSPLVIQMRILEELVTLLWVFYIQIKLENLGLPSCDRSVDD